MGFRKGDWIRFTDEARNAGAIKGDKYGTVMTEPRGVLVTVKLDGQKSISRFHSSFLELVASREFIEKTKR